MNPPHHSSRRIRENKSVSPGGRLALVFALVCLFGFGINESNANCTAIPQTPHYADPHLYPEPPNRLVVTYIHKTDRCDECKALESFTRELIDSVYAVDKRLGRLYLQILNYEAPENETFAKEHNITTHGVMLIRYKNNRVAERTKLDYITAYGMNKPVIQRFLHKEIGQLIGKIY